MINPIQRDERRSLIPSTLVSGTLLNLQPSSEPPSFLLLVSVVLGLPLALWTYKVKLSRQMIYFMSSRQAEQSSVLDIVSLSKEANLHGWAKYLPLLLSNSNQTRISVLTGYIPPGTRQERLADVRSVSSSKLLYEETMISSTDGVRLSALIVKKRDPADPSCVVLYLQGLYSPRSCSTPALMIASSM